MDILTAAAVLPAAILLIYVYRLDPVEKEPGSLLGMLLVMGMLSTIPAIILEMVGTQVFFGSVDTETQSMSLTAMLVDNYIVVALVEEGCKYVFLRWKTWNNPNFDYVFDGIVYAVFVGLGFAIAENISYTYSYGLGVAVGRAFTAIPGHCMFAIFMGYFYGNARKAASHGKNGLAAANNFFALVVPLAFHGTYDFLASYSDTLFLINLVVIVLVGVKLIKRAASKAERIY
jgi:RsiW-degrading membrane proteinase PrsW (M82 family)